MDDSIPPERNSAARGDTSITRVLGILDLFTPDTPVWTVDALVEYLSLGRATIYRYVKALCDAGFLVPVAGAGYVLGPRFIEFDRSIRLSGGTRSSPSHPRK
jgi:DNA-binding IclR family transcriptional regulator